MSTEKQKNIDFLSTIARIKAHKKFQHDWEVADLLGYTREAFSERKRRNSAPVDKLKMFCEMESICIDWLLYEKGPKYRERKGVEPAGSKQEHQGETGTEVVKYVGLSREEQTLFDMLYAIFKGKNVDNRKAIIENIKAFYKTRDVVNMDCPGEIKKTNCAG